MPLLKKIAAVGHVIYGKDQKRPTGRPAFIKSGICIAFFARPARYFPATGTGLPPYGSREAPFCQDIR